ncbi:hypothetical protein LILY_63 [Bacteriophage Lily]|uniref:Uncharacterized protein n=1 Tax=Bacteriophage Lily TaxID=1589751 RepID=A0A0C5AEM3_9CAUD|nr:DNA methyltransferase [Bacteriophage Lily]AJK27787.1 hypothetical protein LILY_63 [Bacteriophage Lily]
MESSQEIEQLTLFPQDTLANLSVMPGSEKARKMTVTSGQKLLGSYRKFGPIGSSVRMLLGTSLWGSMMCYLTWKILNTPRKHLLFQLVPSGPYTEETGYLYLPTPTASMGKGAAKDRYRGSFKYKGSFTMEALRHGPEDPQYMNPNYCELIMGFPIKWTDLDH